MIDALHIEMDSLGACLDDGRNRIEGPFLVVVRINRLRSEERRVGKECRL